MRAVCRLLYLGREGLPLLPSACARHVQAGHHLTAQAVEPHLYPAASQSAGHAGREQAGLVAVEPHVLQLDIVAVVDIAHIDAHLVVLLRLDATREGHRLGLHPLIGIEGAHGLHTLVGRHDGGKTAVGVILELLYGHAASEAASPGKLACMIEEIGMTLVVGHAAVVGERIGGAEGHNLAGIGPGAGGRGSRAVADVLGHAAGRIEQLIGLRLVHLVLRAVHLPEPGSLHVGILVCLALLALVHGRASEGLLGHVEASQLAAVGNHVAVQLQVVALGIAPHEPSLSVVVDHHGGVDMVPRAILEEGLAQGIPEGTSGRIADRYADGHTLRYRAMGADIPIELAVALDGLTGPGTVIGPREALEGQGRAMILPVDHIRCGIDAPLLHPEEIGIILVVAGIDIHATIVNHRGRVAGEPSLHKGILCMGSQGRKGHQGCSNSSVFHFILIHNS